MKDEHLALAKAKLVGPSQRTKELDHLSEVLEEGESVVTMADALFRRARIERRGLAVLTDRRLLCVDKASSASEVLAVELSGVTSVESTASGGFGDARRGELTIVSGDVTTEVGRIQPWERADEIRESVIQSYAAGE